MKKITFVLALLLIFPALNAGCGSSVEAIQPTQIDATKYFKDIQGSHGEIILNLSNVWLPKLTTYYADEYLKYNKEQQLLLTAVIWSYGLIRIKKFTVKDKQKLQAYMDQIGYSQLETFEENTQHFLRGWVENLLHSKVDTPQAPTVKPVPEEEKDNS